MGDGDAVRVMSELPFDVNLLIEKIRLSMPLQSLELPDEFFPAHLSVALVDAVFPSQYGHTGHAIPVADRYCRRLEIAYTRADRWELPPPEEQDTLPDLIRRYNELGVDRMADEFFWTDQSFPETKLTRADQVLRAARELRQIGICMLQDVRARCPEKIAHLLRGSVGLGESTIRRFLMYTGDDDFVRGDVHVQKFVADAIGRKAVSAVKAEDHVRRAAYELILSPQYLDHEIWRYSLLAQTAHSGTPGRQTERRSA